MERQSRTELLGLMTLVVEFAGSGGQIRHGVVERATNAKVVHFAGTIALLVDYFEGVGSTGIREFWH